MLHGLPRDLEAEECQPPGIESGKMLIRLLERKRPAHEGDVSMIEETFAHVGGAIRRSGDLARSAHVRPAEHESAAMLINEARSRDRYHVHDYAGSPFGGPAFAGHDFIRIFAWRRQLMGLKIAAAAAVLLAALSFSGWAQNTGQMINVTSGGKDYVSYLSAPQTPGIKPGIVLVHSFNGLEQGYKDLVDRFASQGFVVLAVGWQTFEKRPTDAVMAALLKDAIAVLRARDDVDGTRLGLTGFCAGGRYTMLFLPTIQDFEAGVAWYGFPNAGGSDGQPVKPIDEIGMLKHPLLMIHGSADAASPIAGIYQYATALQKSGKYFELKVYQGLPHGFMVQDGQLWRTDIADDAFGQMVGFFKRMLK